MFSSSRNHIFAYVRAFLLLASAVVLFSSCSVDSPKDRPETNQNGTFYVSSVNFKEMRVIENKDFGFPESNLYYMEVCVREQGTKRPVVRHKFNVSNIVNGQTYTTREDGCFVYEDKIEFNFLNYETKNVELIREIQADGIQRGFQQIKYAICPMNRGKNCNKYYDLDRLDPPSNLVSFKDSKKYLRGEDAKKAMLWVEKVENIQFTYGHLTDKGYISDIYLQMIPQIKYEDVNGTVRFYPLEKGEFLVEPYLISKMTSNLIKSNRKVISFESKKSFRESTKMENLRLRATKELLIPILPATGELEVGVKVRVNDKFKSVSANLKSFQGVYSYGSYNKIVGSKSKTINHDSTKMEYKYKSDDHDFSLEKYVDDFDGKFVKKIVADAKKFYSKVEHTEKEKKKQKLENIENEIDEKLLIDFEAPSDWKMNRYEVIIKAVKFNSYGKISLPYLDVNYNVFVCVIDPFNGGAGVQKHEFTILQSAVDKDGKRKVTKEKSDAYGCFNWSDQLRFKAYDKEHYHFRSFIIKSEQLAFRSRRGIAINPWDFGFTFGSAAKTKSKYIYEGQDLASKPPSTVYIPDFTYRNLGFDYIIDENLNLILKKHMVIRIHPDYMGYHSLTRLKPIWPLYPGKYLLKLVLMRNFYEDPYHAGEYISHVTKLVEVYRGRIMTDVTFEIDNIRLMGSRNVLMIEIFPVDERNVDFDNKEGEILPIGDYYYLREDKSRDSWDALIDENSGLVSRPYVGPILILNETGGAAVLPSLQKTRLNSLSRDNLNKLLRSLIPGNESFADVMNGYTKKERIETLKLLNKNLQNPQIKKVGKSTVESMNTNYGQEYQFSSDVLKNHSVISRREQSFAIPETTAKIPNLYDMKDPDYQITDKEGKVKHGLPESHPTMKQEYTVANEGVTKSVGKSQASLFGKYDPNGPMAQFIDDRYKEGLRRLGDLMNIKEGHDQYGTKILSDVDLDKFEKEHPDYVTKRADWLNELIPIAYMDDRTQGMMVGYLPPRHDITTKEMIVRGKEIKKIKKQLAEENARFEYFIKQNHLQLVVLNEDLSADEEIDLGIENVEDRLNTTDFLLDLANPLWKFRRHPDFETFVTDRRYNHSGNYEYSIDDESKRPKIKPFPSIDKEEFYNLINPRDTERNDDEDDRPYYGKMSENLARAMCKYWFLKFNRKINGKEVFGKVTEGLPIFRNKISSEIASEASLRLANICEAQAENYQNIFAISRKIRVHKFNADNFQHDKGLSVNMSVNNGVDWSYGQSKSFSEGTKIDAGFKLNALIFNVGSSFSSGVSRNENFANGIKAGSGNSVQLVVQENKFKLMFDEYEYCVSIKLNPLGYGLRQKDPVFYKKGLVKIYWNENLSDDEKELFYKKGIFICTGEKKTKPKSFNEMYYYITQHFNVGHSFDMPSIKNRWFDIALRGKQTFATFSKLLYTEQFGKMKDSNNREPIGRGTGPLEALLPIYSNLPTSYHKIYSLPIDPKTFVKFNWSMQNARQTKGSTLLPLY